MHLVDFLDYIYTMLCKK